MSELREEVARRLGFVYRTRAGYPSPEVHWGDRDEPNEHNENAERLLWLFVADECILQMSAAWRQGYYRYPLALAHYSSPPAKEGKDAP